MWLPVMAVDALELNHKKKIRIPWAKPLFAGSERRYLLDVFDSGWISQGPYVERFEKDFSRLHRGRHVLSVSSGTSALQLILAALGIGRGDDVIVPAFAFAAAANMVMACGARCVFADIDQATWCLDPVSVEKRLTSKTKAIIAVHLYGNMCDMGALAALAKKKKVYLIEDAAEAAFSRYRNRPAGTFGEAAIFSFQAAKTIAMGEGGCVLTPDKRLWRRMRIMRDHGMCQEKRYWHDIVGYNFRMTDLQGAIGCAQLENFNVILSHKRRVFKTYHKYLSQEPALVMQEFKEDVEPVVWALAFRIKPSFFKKGRDGLRRSLLDCGIETRPGFYPAGMMPLFQAPRLPVAQRIGLNVICLPSFASLTDKEISFICRQIKKLALKVTWKK